MALMERNCIACGQVGTDPRHVAVLPDQNEAAHHHDCGKRMSPPCPVCVAVLDNAEVPENTTGEAMRELLVAAPVIDLDAILQGA